MLPPDIFEECAGWWIRGHNKCDPGYSIMQPQPTHVQDIKFAHDDLTAGGTDHRVPSVYHGSTVYLLKDSPLLRWSELGLDP